MTTHHITVCRSQTPTGKHYSPTGAVNAEQPNTWVHGVVRAFETIEELAEILREVANDAHAILIPNAVLGVPDGEPILIGSLAQVANYRGMPNDGVWQAVRNAGPIKTQSGEWVIARNLEAFAPANVFVLDRDVKPDTPAEFATGMDFNAWRRSVGQIIPGADTCDCVVMPSSSARILDTRTGQPLSSKSGHVWVLTDSHFDASLEPRGKGSKLATRVKAAAMRSGQCWVKETAEGKRILQMPLDISVAIKGRWVFSGAPSADLPFTVAPSTPQVIKGSARTVQLDTIPDATDAEFRILNERYGTSITVSGDYLLTMGTEVETKEFGTRTIADLHALYLAGLLGAAEDVKIRCQAVFRPESRSWNGILRLVKAEHSEDLQWLHHDQGEAQNSWLNDDGMRTINPGWTPDKFRGDSVLAKVDPSQWQRVGSATPITKVDTSPGVVTPPAGDVVATPTTHVMMDEGVRKWLDREIKRAAESCAPITLAEIDPLFNREAVQAMFGACVVNAANGRWHILNGDGALVQFSGEEAKNGFFAKLTRDLGVNPFDSKALTAMLAARRDEIKALSNTPGQPTYADRPKSQQPKDAGEWADMRIADIFSRISGICHSNILTEIQAYRQAISIRMRIDPWAASSSLTFNPETQRATLIRPWRRFSASEAVDAATVLKVVKDYRQHFPQFDVFLGFIAACRFSEHRRQSFLWMLAHGGSGKGMLIAALKDLDLLFEFGIKELELAIEGKPSGMPPEEIGSSIVMAVDEWKSLSGSLKNINSEISLAAKGQMRTTLPVYAKWFTSAEVPLSLTESGTDKQFSDRISMFDCRSHGFIDDRELVQKIGSNAYRRALSVHIAAELNRQCDEYIALGKHRAADVADAWLKEFNRAYSLKRTFGALDDDVEEVGREFRAWMLETAEKGLAGANLRDDTLRKLTDPKVFHYVEMTSGRGRGLRVCDPASLLKAWWVDRHGTELSGQLGRKVDNILDVAFKGASIGVQRFKKPDGSPGIGRGRILPVP